MEELEHSVESENKNDLDFELEEQLNSTECFNLQSCAENGRTTCQGCQVYHRMLKRMMR